MSEVRGRDPVGSRDDDERPSRDVPLHGVEDPKGDAACRHDFCRGDVCRLDACADAIVKLGERVDAHTMTKQGFGTAYRGYLIKPAGIGGSNGFSIQKDGHHIGYVPSVPEAKKIIDQLIG